MKPEELFTDVKQEENPDWGYARNCRIALRRQDCEFVQSVFSTGLEDLVGPNRDYPHEGLTVLIDGRNLKFLDAIFFGVKKENRFLRVEGETVKVFPWKAVYEYKAFENGSAVGKVLVEYYLLRKRNCPQLRVCFRTNFAADAIIIKPLVDLRDANGRAEGTEYKVYEREKTLFVEKNGYRLMFSGPRIKSILLGVSEQLWNYKLGSGAREERNGFTVFKNEMRMLLCAGELEIELKKNEAELFLSCRKASELVKKVSMLSLAEYDERNEVLKIQRDLKKFKKYFEKAKQVWGENEAKAISARFIALTKFGIPEFGGVFPEAGGFWFREVWFRDLLEGLYNNFDVYYAIKKRDLKKNVVTGLALQSDGLLPAKVGSAEKSVDAVLLSLLVAMEYLKRSADKKTAALLEEKSAEMLESYSKGDAVKLDETGLLKCPANWGWTDSIYAGMPKRLPVEWIAEMSKKGEEGKKEAFDPKYYLVEVNALWIKCLRELEKLSGKTDWSEIRESAEGVFKKKFLENGFLAHIVSDEFGKGAEESSMALCAYSLLPDLFSKEELNAASRVAEEKLFVRRKGKLFGSLVRNLGKKVFYGDDEYHEATVWPRDNPYLVRLLLAVGERNKAEEILLSNLDHQQTEGVIFYNHELFALPEGRNPASSGTSELVPVKNPIQYWSQYVQPYFDFLDSVK
ncbi:hypothetical protein HY991_02225 [Candidatus Micrarchaeota archaeon]|nr:hypothetical protein [Candidatus Micrarchaeota archaeon]